jgi:hypothetical protein
VGGRKEAGDRYRRNSKAMTGIDSRRGNLCFVMPGTSPVMTSFVGTGDLQTKSHDENPRAARENPGAPQPRLLDRNEA